VRGLWNLTWLEIKIFVREPLGLIGNVIMPVAVFVGLGRMMGGRVDLDARSRGYLDADIPVLVVMLIALNAVLSLVTIIAIYREGGILKRLRATPLRPHTILTAHVLVKLIFSGVTLLLTAAAGRRFYPVALDAPWLGVTAALLISTISILSIGFLVASLVPTARFAQPVGTALFYPMLSISGLFVPIAKLPAAVQVASHFVPLTYAVSLLRGIWIGDAWSAHVGDVAALVVVFGVCTALSSRLFRWE
jgi:ABC-2 type transport system permease protein